MRTLRICEVFKRVQQRGEGDAMGRMCGMLWIGSALLAVALMFCCHSTRDRTRSMFLESLSKFSRVAWAEELGGAQREEAIRRFDCVWDGLVTRGADPAHEFRCSIQQLDFLTPCMENQSTDEVVRCHEGVREICTSSSSFQAAESSCVVRIDSLGVRRF